MYQAQPMSVAHLELVRHQFDLTLAVLLFLALILGGMLIIDLRRKKRIVRRFGCVFSSSYLPMSLMRINYLSNG